MLLERGTSQLKLAELAAGLGESSRMLCHHFGSRNALVAEALQHARGEMLSALKTQLSAHQARDLRALVGALREIVAAPANGPYFRLFAEISALAKQDPERFPGFAYASVHDWLPQLTATLVTGGQDERRAQAEATLALAIVRGLLLDENSTGETARIQDAYEAFGAR